MKQQIRNQTFETNSSSVHSVVLFDDVTKEYGLEENISIMVDNPKYLLKEPKEILSYIYTTFLYHHKWYYIRDLKEKFPNCIFEKPYWADSHTGDGFYSDDKEITTFCDLYDSDFCNCFTDKHLRIMWKCMYHIVFNGEVLVQRDCDYEDYIKHHNNWDEDSTKRWLDENVKIIIEDNKIED